MKSYKERCEQFKDAVKSRLSIYLNGELIDNVKDAKATDPESGQSGEITLEDGTKLFVEVEIRFWGDN